MVAAIKEAARSVDEARLTTGEVMEEMALVTLALVAVAFPVDEVLLDCFLVEVAAELNPDPDPDPPPLAEPLEVMVTSESSS